MNPTDNNNLENRQVAFENDEIEIGQLINTIWSGRGLILGVALGFLLLVGIFFGSRFLISSEHRTQDIQISFPFSGAEKGEYPNGTGFQLSDIISSQVLSVVHEKQKLSEMGISLEGFTNNISIRPAAIDREFIDKKYKTRLSTEDLSQAEIEELESGYKAELTIANHRAALLSYSYGSRDLISSQQIGQILFDIPETWASITVNEHGVLTPPVIDIRALSSAEELRNVDFLIGITLMKGDTKAMLTASNLVVGNDRLSRIHDPVSGLSIIGLVHRLQKFDQFHLEPALNLISSKNIYRNAAYIEVFLNSSLQMLTDQLNAIEKKVAIFSNAYQETLAASRNFGTGLQLPRGTTTETQIGDAFLGQLLKLGDELSESTFRQYLLEHQIKLKTQAEDMNVEIVQLKRQLAGLKINGHELEDSTFEPYEKAVEEFMTLVVDYDNIINLVRNHVLSNTGALYESMNSTARVSSFDKIQMKRIIKLALVAWILGGMVGVFITLMRKSANPKIS